MEPRPGIKIAPERLTPETLTGVIEELVTRDGTNLAEAETKIGEVRAQIERGAAEIWFDEETRTCNILVSPQH